MASMMGSAKGGRGRWECDCCRADHKGSGRRTRRMTVKTNRVRERRAWTRETD